MTRQQQANRFHIWGKHKTNKLYSQPLGAGHRVAGWIRCHFGTRQQYSKRSAFVRLACKIDGSAEIPNDPLHYSEPESPARRFGREEWVEHLSLRLGGHAATSVGNL